jgi:hypothetical protein
MKIVFVINSKKYFYHKDMLRQFLISAEKYGTCRIIDLSVGTAFHMIYDEIEQSGCDLLISLDLAGFEFRTETNTLSYNNLGCRMAHVLFRGMHEYREELRQQMNFSMFLFSMREEDVAVMNDRYPNIPNVERIERMEYRHPAEEDMAKSRNIINKWFAHIMDEMELAVSPVS